MKKIILLIAFIVLTELKQAHALTRKSNPIDYIEFVHTGVSTVTINPLFISTTKPELHLNKRQIADLKEILKYSKKELTPEREKQYLEGIYDIIITNSKTYNIVKEFILTHKEFYVTTKNTNFTGEPSYNIHIGNKMNFSIYYKLKDRFIKELKNVILRGDGDKKVLDAFSFR